MKRNDHFAQVLGFILLSAVIAGCGPKKIERPMDSLGTTCVGGTVWYRGSTHPDLVRYPFAKITVWRHKTDSPLGETQAGKSGNYCIEVPAGDFKMDLRIWGLQRLGKLSYTCNGSGIMRTGRGGPGDALVGRQSQDRTGGFQQSWPSDPDELGRVAPPAPFAYDCGAISGPDHSGDL